MVIVRNTTRLCRLGLALGLATLAVGCIGTNPKYETPTAAGIDPADVFDPTANEGATETLLIEGLNRVSTLVKKSYKPEELPPKRSILLLSGGGSYGAYSAGLIVGWTATGTRPQFDVVTGVSTGSLIAVFAFLGPQYDPQLQYSYTMVRSSDIFRIRRSIRSVLNESFADNTPLEEMIRLQVTPQLLSDVAAAHAQGRRLYVGTTDLDGRRQVIWDMGAIAAQGTPQAADLFVRVLLASAAIPGFFAPVKVPVNINGQVYEERHIDGGVTTALFFRPPYIPPSKHGDICYRSLYDSDVYAVIAGKLFADAEPVPARTPAVVSNAVSTLLSAQTRSNLLEIFAVTAVTGMDFRLSAVPQPYELTGSATNFDPAVMSALFMEGVRQIQAGTAWRDTPPGILQPEQAAVRKGSSLVNQYDPSNGSPMPIEPGIENLLGANPFREPLNRLRRTPFLRE